MLQRISLNLINIYQEYLRSILPSSCRFLPTCSEYTKQAIIKYGFLKGLCKGIKRLALCHPFAQKSGDDPLV